MASCYAEFIVYEYLIDQTRPTLRSTLSLDSLSLNRNSLQRFPRVKTSSHVPENNDFLVIDCMFVDDDVDANDDVNLDLDLDLDVDWLLWLL